MYQWSINVKKLRTHASFPKWRMEQMINFGLDGQKLSRRTLMRYWDTLTIDPDRRRYLALLLWGKKKF